MISGGYYKKGFYLISGTSRQAWPPCVYPYTGRSPYRWYFLFSCQSFLFILSPSAIIQLASTSADKRYIPKYTTWQRPLQGGFGLSASLTYGLYRLFSYWSCRMLTLKWSIRKSFGISSECLWNVMQRWRPDLWHSSIARKENEPAANIIWSLVHYYVFLAATISFFSFPFIPPGVRHFAMKISR